MAMSSRRGEKGTLEGLMEVVLVRMPQYTVLMTELTTGTVRGTDQQKIWGGIVFASRNQRKNKDLTGLPKRGGIQVSNKKSRNILALVTENRGGSAFYEEKST